jgi:hypothetical protein
MVRKKVDNNNNVFANDEFIVRMVDTLAIITQFLKQEFPDKYPPKKRIEEEW